jgi:hypothetical protein
MEFEERSTIMISKKVRKTLSQVKNHFEVKSYDNLFRKVIFPLIEEKHPELRQLFQMYLESS